MLLSALAGRPRRGCSVSEHTEAEAWGAWEVAEKTEAEEERRMRVSRRGLLA